MVKPFKLKRGMYLVISKVLENETPEIIAFSFSYKRVWDHWVNNPDREWELALVRTFETEGKREIHQVWRIHRPIPPKRYRLRLLRGMQGKHN
jgi:hypothetical protein